MTVEALLAADVRSGIERLEADLARFAPHVADRFWAWLRTLAPGVELDSLFLHPGRFPFLKLPYWILEASDAESDPAFLHGLTRSSVSGYCLIRLVDELMDEPDSRALPLLPIGPFLQVQFLAPYWEHFPDAQDVRSFLSRAWAESAESTFRDTQLRDIREPDFMDVCARKMSATRIPVFAACRRAGKPADGWLSFVEALGVFEQFLDDLFDWHLDLRTGRSSYLLSEARRQATSAAGVVPWMLSEGITWANDTLARYFVEARERAVALDSDPLLDHLESRRTGLEQALRDIERGARDLAALRQAFFEDEH